MADAPETPTPEAPVAPEIETPKVEPKEPDKKPVIDATKPLSSQVDSLLKAVPEKDADKPADSKPEEPKEDEKKPEEPALEPEAPKETEPEAADVKAVELPEWQKYVIDKLQPIQTIGHEGEGKDKVYSVKRLEDLPLDFEFADRRSELAFMAANSSQELNARELLAQYKQQEQQNVIAEMQNQEALDVQADINALQKEGILPKFQYEPDDPKFNSDPAVKEANDVYDLFTKTNQAYARANKTYRISYRDAADKYFAAQSRNKPEAPPTPDKPKEPDKPTEREKVAAQVGAPAGSGAEKGKLRMPSGAQMTDVLRLYNQGRI